MTLSNAHIQRLIGLFGLLVPIIGAWVIAGALQALAWVALAAAAAAFVLALECAIAAWHNRVPAGAAWSLKPYGRAWVGELLRFPRVFLFEQPWRQHLYPDRPAPATPAHAGLTGNAATGADDGPPIVFIHGFFCNRGFWNPWMKRLQASPRAYIALTLEPPFGAIDRYVDGIDAAVRRLHEATGKRPVLVCHSMGGLAARAWLRQRNDDQAVAAIVTIGSPHRGTWMAKFSFARNAAQMRLDSPWLDELARSETPERRARMTCWHSDTDNIVVPAHSARLEGARSCRVSAAGHVELAFAAQVMEATLDLRDEG